MVRVAVEAHPGTSREQVTWLTHGALGVWVRARAVDGEANRAIEQAIAAALRLRPRQVQIVAGATRRQKMVEVDVQSLEELRARLTTG